MSSDPNTTSSPPPRMRQLWRHAGRGHNLDASQIPDHDLLAAGFPCQPFSIAGVSQKRSLGMPDGFADRTQGPLFFDLAHIIREKRPGAFILENVKNLKSHDGGRTFGVITETLAELGYDVHHCVLDARTVVPQHRERIFIVGFDRPTDFVFPDMPEGNARLGGMLQNGVNAWYTLSDNLWRTLQRHTANSRGRRTTDTA